MGGGGSLQRLQSMGRPARLYVVADASEWWPWQEQEEKKGVCIRFENGSIDVSNLRGNGDLKNVMRVVVCYQKNRYCHGVDLCLLWVFLKMIAFILR
jgi:hypothetical protein